MSAQIGANSPVDYNQKFIELVQYFDTFISNRNRKATSVWIDRVPRGQLDPESGLVRQVNIFHGPTGEQAGLLNFRRIQKSRVANGDDPGIDACGVQPKQFGYGWETRQYTGYQGEWESEPICIEDIAYTHQASEQASMIAMTVPKITLSVWETWNREQWLLTSVMGGNAHIMAREGQDLASSTVAQYEYDPYVSRDFGNGVPETFVRYPAAVQPGSLDWTHMIWWQDYLGDECPEAALTEESGRAVFGLMLNLRDFEEMIRNDADLRQDYRDAKPDALIDGYPKAFMKYRGWILIHDARQARFNIIGVEDDGGTDYVVARRVEPLLEVAGAIGNTTEANKEYQSAELAVGVVFMNEVLQNLVPVPIGTLAKDMVFGTQPGYNGEFTWMNIQDRQTNPLQNTGNYFGRFRIFPKPLLYHNRVITFLYSRCPHANGRDCQKLADGVTAVTSTTLSRDLVAGDYDATTNILTIPVAAVMDLEVGQGIEITRTTGPAQVPGYVVGTLTPTLIQVAFTTDQSAIVTDFDSGNAVALT